MNQPPSLDGLTERLEALAAEESARPVRVTARMIQLKAELARADARRLAARRIEGWALGSAGTAVVAVTCLSGAGSASALLGLLGLVGPGALWMLTGLLAGFALTRVVDG